MPSHDPPFPDISRQQLDQLLIALRDGATDVLSTQGRLRGLLRANAAVASDLSLPVVLRRIVDAARDLMESRFAAIGVIGHDGRLEQFVHSEMDAEMVERIGALPPGRGILGEPIVDVVSIRLESLSGHDPLAGGYQPGSQPTGAFLGIPVQVGGEVYGNLYVAEKNDGRAFTEEDEELATALASTAGVAITNARLFTESEQRRRWIAAAGELTRRLLTTSTDEPFDQILQGAAMAAEADFATLMLPVDESSLVIKAVFGAGTQPLLGRMVPTDDSLAGQAISTGKPLLVREHRHQIDELTSTIDVGPLIVVPLAAGEQSRGALTLGRASARDGFTDAEKSMAGGFGTHAAMALELIESRNAHLHLAQLEDHDRIARDLHDHVIQEVFAVGIGLQSFAGTIAPPFLENRLAGYVDSLDRVIARIRGTILELRSGPQYGSVQARLLAVASEQVAQLGFTPEMRLDGPLDRVLTGDIINDILVVAGEALTNCALHAGAHRVAVVLAADEDLVTLTVTDDGRGVGDVPEGAGLRTMRRLAKERQGSLDVAVPEGGGTQLVWAVRVLPASGLGSLSP